MIATLHSRARALVAFAKRKLQLATDYQSVYRSAEGERVLLDILREAGVLTVSHVEGDKHTSTFNEGKRAVGLYVIERLRWSEAELVELARRGTTDQLNEDEG